MESNTPSPETSKRGATIPRSTTGKLWGRHLAISGCLFLLTLPVLFFLQPAATNPEWREILNKDFGLDGLHVHAAPLEDRWRLDDLSSVNGITRGRLVLYQASTLRTKEDLPVAGLPWEITMRWEEGCRRRPQKGWQDRRDPMGSAFSVVLSGPDREGCAFQVDPEGCGLTTGDGDGSGGRGDCSESCREAIHGRGPHTLTLREGEDFVSARVDGDLCASAPLHRPFDALGMAISSPAHACVAFDDIILWTEAPESGRARLFEEHFDVNPLESDWLETRFDLDSLGSRILVAAATLILALLFDLAVLGLFGRRSPVEAILSATVPQTLSILALQPILLLPLVPLLCSVSTVLVSKAVLALSDTAGPLEDEGLRTDRTMWSFFAAAIIFLIAFSAKNGLRVGSPPVFLGAAAVTTLVALQTGTRAGGARKRKSLFWSALCALQVLHWIWFKALWPFLGYETFLLISTIPVLLLVGLCFGTKTRPGQPRIGRGFIGRLFTVVLLVVCVELTARSIPMVDHFLTLEKKAENTH